MKGKRWPGGAVLLGALLMAALLVAGNSRREIPSVTQLQQPEQPTTETQTWTPEPLPWCSQDGTLVAEALFPYPRTGEAGLMVCNTGSRGISFACISLRQAGQTLYFFIDWLPPGERLLVAEHSGKPYGEGTVSDCRCAVIRWERFQPQPEQIHTALSDDRYLAVTNLSDSEYTCVVIRYRRWDTQLQCYLGAAEAAYFPGLEAGECRLETWREDAVIVSVEFL